MIDCFIYTAERQTLFSLFEHYIPQFIYFNKKRKQAGAKVGQAQF